MGSAAFPERRLAVQGTCRVMETGNEMKASVRDNRVGGVWTTLCTAVRRRGSDLIETDFLFIYIYIYF